MYFGFLNRPAILALLCFLILASLFTVLTYQRYLILKQVQRKEAYEAANEAIHKLQHSLTYSLSAAKILSFFVDLEGKVNNFDSIASQIIASGSEVDALQLAPNGVIKYVYPVWGNEKAINYDILNDPGRNKEALESIESRQWYFAGPYELRQGGKGVVGRLPIYRNNKFWGFSTVVIKVPTLLKAAGIDTSGNSGYYYQLSKIDPDTKAEEFFLSHTKNPSEIQSVSVNVPNGLWKLYVGRSMSFHDLDDIFLLIVFGSLFSILGALFIFYVARRPRILDELVRVRTRQLKESEEKFSKAFHSNLLGQAIYDTDFVIVDVNEPYAVLLESRPEELIGKTSDEAGLVSKISINKRQAISNEIELLLDTDGYLENYEIGIESKTGKQHTILLSIEKLELNDKKHWLASAIDISAAKSAELQMRQSEEKYRNLVEQASDGIVITDLDGNIIEVNNSICRMSGYTEKEMQGQHLYKFIPEEDIEKKPLRIQELMQGKALLYERRLLKKDGSVLPVEVNSKMASSHTLIGFIRDISGRKSTEESLRLSEESYRSLVEQASDAIFIADKQGKFLMMNSSGYLMSQFSSEELKGLSIYDLVPPEDLQTNPFHFADMMTAKGARVERRLKRKDGSLLDVEVTAKFISGERFLAFVRDISDRKKAEEEIRKSNERFELIAQATNDAVWDHDFEKNETWGNKKLYSLYGFSGEEKVNFEMFLEHIHPDERLGIVQRMSDAINKSVNSVSEEFLFLTADGNYRYFYDRAYIKYDTDGKPQRILGAMQDITEREEIKKQTLREKELSDSIINSLPGVFYLFNKEGRYLRWNKNLEAVTGYSNEEISQIHPLDLFDENEKQLITEKIGAVFVNGHDWVEANFLLKSKEKVLYYFTGQYIEYEGQPCLMGVGIDISEKEKAAHALRESEKKYRLLFYNNPVPMWMATIPELRIVDVNEAAIKQYGYSREEFLQLTTMELRPEEDVEHFLREVGQMEAGSLNIRSWRHKKKDGTIIHVETYSHQVLYEGRMVWLGLSHDVSEQYKAKELLQKSYEEIRQLASNLQSIREDERTNIAREIHDELGQQLTGLKMDMHWLFRKLQNADTEVSGKMNESIELINKTITTVRKIATDLRPSILDDLGLLAALEWQSEEFERRSGTRVMFTNKAGDISVTSKAATTLFRIYQEVLTNIARHAKASQVVTLLDSDDKSLYFSIRDNGIGFDVDSTKEKKTLGLVGIKERSLLIGGTYEIKSNPGKGSEVQVSIPLEQVKEL